MTIVFFPSRWYGILLPCCLATLLVAGTLRAAAPVFDELERRFAQDVRPLVTEYCGQCHGVDNPEDDVNLVRFTTLKDVRSDVEQWLHVRDVIRNREMPPANEPQPTDAQREVLESWLSDYLRAESQVNAGDPGPVIPRRLSNAEYTYTIQDLTGVTLYPAKEFPVDSAAGEGFTNSGAALVMSSALLQKYFDAGKEIARHLVPLPDGVRFSPGVSRRDWSDELQARIMAFHAKYADAEGKLPLAAYLRATLEEREALASGSKTLEEVATERGLNARYLATLWRTLHQRDDSSVLAGVRQLWTSSEPADVDKLVAHIQQWQQALSRFQNVGHLKAWMVDVHPLAAKQDVQLPLNAPPEAREVTLYLVANPAADGNQQDYVVWNRPRLVAPGRPELLLRDVRRVTGQLAKRREQIFSSTANCLAAAIEAGRANGPLDAAQLAKSHQVAPDVLAAWLDYLGIQSGSNLQLEHMVNRLESNANYDFVKGWGSNETPNLVANSSDQAVRIPGALKAHGVAMHPSPTHHVAVGWSAPAADTVRLRAQLASAHPECGNGVTWSVELRRGATRQRLATGVVTGGAPADTQQLGPYAVQAGDLLSVLVGPRDGDHACDLTEVEFLVESTQDATRIWNLAADISQDPLQGNPHADQRGNASVWHFYTEAVSGTATGPVIPAGSLLGRWQAAQGNEEKQRLAAELQQLLIQGPPAEQDHPDRMLHQQLTTLSGPLFTSLLLSGDQSTAPADTTGNDDEVSNTDNPWGLDPRQFGHHPNGTPIDESSLCVQAPSILAIKLPADLVNGSQFVVTGALDPATGAEGSVQLRVTTDPPSPTSTEQLDPSVPIVTQENSATAQGLLRAFADFRSLFPAAICYPRIVPIDEVVTLTLFHREDGNLMRLMLDDQQRRELDRLWEELHFVSQDAFAQVDAFAQLMEYATQDSDPRLFEGFREPIQAKAGALRQALLDAEPAQLAGVLAIAERAFRRPMTDREREALRTLYAKLREQEIPHDDAIRLLLARVLVSPTFLYRFEQAASASPSGPVNDWELASRLSYFLWSSAPDEELRQCAAEGRLHEPAVLAAQARRMLRDPRVRRLSTEFACQWLHIYDFDQLDEKSETHFPTFVDVRDEMYEEAIRFFTELFQQDRPVLEVLDADYTFVNETLAQHYGMTEITGSEWRKVEGWREQGRGGILGLGATLAKQSGASRTSPILRGNWIAEVVLGDKLPKPPKGVPQLPEDETATAGLTVRQLVEKHSNDERCAGCHRRIDPFGYSLEGFDAIGRQRTRDLADRPIDVHARVMDGSSFEGLDGLRNYLLTTRRDDILAQFCRKLLGYSLGRGVQLTDLPLLEEMQRNLAANDYRFSAAVETILQSRQFREIRAATP